MAALTHLPTTSEPFAMQNLGLIRERYQVTIVRQCEMASEGVTVVRGIRSAVTVVWSATVVLLWDLLHIT